MHANFCTIGEMRTLSEIVAERLDQLDLSPITAARSVGLGRTYIRDIVAGNKKDIRREKLPQVAEALRLDPEALGRGELVPIDEATGYLAEDGPGLDMELLAEAQKLAKETVARHGRQVTAMKYYKIMMLHYEALDDLRTNKLLKETSD